MADTLHTLSIPDEDYKKAAIQWRSSLLYMPVLGAMEALKYMTPMPGLTLPTKLPTVDGEGQFAPFKADRKSADTTLIQYRELRTYLGNVRIDFEPIMYIQTLLGAGTASLGEGQLTAPTAKMVMEAVMLKLGAHLHDALFTARRNAAGDTTKDLFDGWATIIDNEISAGNIAINKGNYGIISGQINTTNAVDIAKEMERSCDPVLRRTEKFLYCAPEFADKYNDAYLLSHNAVPYNTKYEQPILEGSYGKTTIIPLDCMSGTDMIIITPKSNMLYGFDNMSDLSRIKVKDYEPWVITLAATMFFGTQLLTLDKRMFKVFKLEPDEEEEEEQPEQQGQA